MGTVSEKPETVGKVVFYIERKIVGVKDQESKIKAYQTQSQFYVVAGNLSQRDHETV